MKFLNICKIKIILFVALISISGSFLNAMTKKTLPVAGEFLQYVRDEQHRRVDYLLKNNLVDINEFDHDLGQTALILAVRGADTKMVKLLLDYGADLSIKDKSGKTAFDYVNELDSKDDKEIIELINNKKKDLLKLEELKKQLAQEPNDISYSNLILENAIKYKDIEALKFLITYYRNNFGLRPDSAIEPFAPTKRKNIKLASGESQLILMTKFKEAIETGNEQLIRDLIKQGANVNYNFAKEEKPLDLALEAVLRGKSTNIIKLLLDFGADPNLSKLHEKMYCDYTWSEELAEIEQALEENISVPVELLKKANYIITTTQALSEINWSKDLSDIVCDYL